MLVLSPAHHRSRLSDSVKNGNALSSVHNAAERKKTDKPREGWEDGTPPPHRDFNRAQCCARPSNSFPSQATLAVLRGRHKERRCLSISPQSQPHSCQTLICCSSWARAPASSRSLPKLRSGEFTRCRSTPPFFSPRALPQRAAAAAMRLLRRRQSRAAASLGGAPADGGPCLPFCARFTGFLRPA